jgi:hypothetical protein
VPAGLSLTHQLGKSSIPEQFLSVLRLAILPQEEVRACVDQVNQYGEILHPPPMHYSPSTHTHTPPPFLWRHVNHDQPIAQLYSALTDGSFDVTKPGDMWLEWQLWAALDTLLRQKMRCAR